LGLVMVGLLSEGDLDIIILPWPPRSGDLQNLHHTTHRSGAKPLILQQPVSTDSLVLVSKKRVCDRTL
jgi:hypothetical protein